MGITKILLSENTVGTKYTLSNIKAKDLDTWDLEQDMDKNPKFKKYAKPASYEEPFYVDVPISLLQSEFGVGIGQLIMLDENLPSYEGCTEISDDKKTVSLFNGA